jgi:hypothetical protein
MSTVYIVKGLMEYEGSDIIKAFTDKTLAYRFADKCNIKPSPSTAIYKGDEAYTQYCSYLVEEVELYTAEDDK